MNYYKAFRCFLRAMMCEEAFDRAFYSYNGYTSLDEALWRAGEPEYIVAHAFDWRATSEGREFWLNVDRAWHRVMGAIKASEYGSVKSAPDVTGETMEG
ncbi:MAG: hypothetical protein J6K38_08935 [Alistipes sp.]|nr:hypothetical protein [Alistipes sp.]